MGNTGVRFDTEDRGLMRLYDLAEKGCRGNLRDFDGRTVLVEGGGYEKIWLETQPMGGEMYAKRSLEAGENNCRLFMEHQRADGRLPGSIERMKDGTLQAQFNKIQGFCFPAPALNMYAWLEGDEAFLRDLRNCLAGFDEYLWTWRDSDGDGLLESFCVYDTGEDNALRYGDAPAWWEKDEAPKGYESVPMASMDFMSYSYACRDALARISRIRGDGKEAYWRGKAEEVRYILREKMWNAERKACFDRDGRGRPQTVLTHNNLRCMYWGSFTREMAEAFVREHLLNPREFWTDMPLPSVAANDPLFRNEGGNNWSGQPEGLTYQRAIRALENYGCEKLVTFLGRRLLRAIQEGGYVFPQQFDPFTGAPSLVGRDSHAPLAPGSAEPVQDAYGPTLLSALEMIAHLWGVHMEGGQIWFSLCRAEKPYLYEQKWGRGVYRVESDGREAGAYVNGRLIARVPCGVRLITDREGKTLETKAIE